MITLGSCYMDMSTRQEQSRWISRPPLASLAVHLVRLTSEQYLPSLASSSAAAGCYVYIYIKQHNTVTQWTELDHSTTTHDTASTCNT